MLTILGMGTATFVIGLLPTAAQIGVFAGVILAALRIVQGLSLGGEYGGAVIYVTEHSPDSKRGYYTSWIQTTATLGFFVALTAVLVTRLEVGTTAFSAWGWRVPFLVSIFLLALGVYLRVKLKETPFFSYIKSKGQLSKNPLRESFGKNWKLITLALLGATAGEGVVWYTGQFWLLYDADCGFCQRWCDWARRRGAERVIAFVPCQSAVELRQQALLCRVALHLAGGDQHLVAGSDIGGHCGIGRGDGLRWVVQP